MFHVEHTRNGNSNYKSQHVPRGTLAQIETKKRVKNISLSFSILI